MTRTPRRVASPRPWAIVAACLHAVAASSGCGRKDAEAYRGARLEVAALPPADLADIYRAALGGPFTMGDPSLSILVDTLWLPRETGLSGGTPMPPAVRAALRDAGVVQGTCTVPVTKTREALVCPAPRPGYVVRLSEPFAVSRDTVQVHVVVEQYAIPGGPRAERLRFERAYLVGRRPGGGWRATREARLPQP